MATQVHPCRSPGLAMATDGRSRWPLAAPVALDPVHAIGRADSAVSALSLIALGRSRAPWLLPC